MFEGIANRVRRLIVKPMRLIAGLAVVVLSQGCSVAIMNMDIEPTDKSSIGVGATRVEVEEVLGAPNETVTTGAGKISTYEYDKGAPADSSYNTARDYLDCMALLNIFCELLMTPLALSERSDLYESQLGLIRITYGPDDKIVDLSYENVVRGEPAEAPEQDRDTTRN